MRKIVIDVVCPYGGRQGGIEDVIYSWTQNLPSQLFDLRILHMTPGIGYLHGYEKAYFLKDDKEFVNASYCATGYNLFIDQLGTPDICVACNEPLAVAACRAVIEMRGLNTVLFSWVHSEIQKYAQSGNGGVPELLKADYHLAINSHIRNELKAGRSDAVVYTVGNPILHDIPESDISIDDRILAYVGRLAPIKRVDIILEALYKAKSMWKLKIIGDGELRDKCEEWVEMLGLKDRVSFLGWQKNPLLFMQDATAFVSASDYEGLMISGIEALAMGKMMISTPHQGALECLKEGENGYYFGFDDADGLARILDDISNGTKKIPSPEKCKESVKFYQKDNYFNILKDIFIGVCNNSV